VFIDNDPVAEQPASATSASRQSAASALRSISEFVLSLSNIWRQCYTSRNSSDKYNRAEQDRPLIYRSQMAAAPNYRKAASK